MAAINLETKDYVLLSLDATFVNDDVQCVCQRLGIHRGKYWANSKLGSRLFTLSRSKDLPRNLLLAKQYAEELREKAHAALARQEQSAVDSDNERLAQALREGNARYEARFGRVFLIRAKGRSGEEILQALTRRLQHTADEEVAEALAQLREITMLRLEGAIGE